MKHKTDTLFNRVRWILTRVWVWLPVTLGVLIVISLILLPYFIRQGVEHWLVEQGAEQVSIEDIDFNLFIGRLAVRNLQFQTAGKRSLVLPQASLRFAVLPLLRRQLLLQDVYLRGTTLAVEQVADGGWRIAGLGLPAATGKPSVWHVTLKSIEITNSELLYSSPALSGKLDIEHGVVKLGPAGGDETTAPLSKLNARLSGKMHVNRTNPHWTIDARINTEIKAKAPSRHAPGSWRIHGQGELLDLDFKWVEGNLRVISAEKLNIEDLDMTGLDQMAIGKFGIKGFALAQPLVGEASPPFLKASQLHAGGLRYLSEQSLTIEEISVNGFNLIATHEKHGSWYGLTPLRAFLKTLESPGPKKPGLTVRIKNITIQEPGQIEVSDYAIQPAFLSRLTLTGATLTGIDTSNAPKTPTNVAIKARIGKYATAELDGQIRAYNPELAANFMFKLRELELPTLSSYSTQMLGYRVVSGQMGGDLDMQIADGQLDGQSKLSFAKLAMKPKDEASAEKLKARLSVPLETGLTMLRDKNNNVNLEVNVSGKIGDPKFDLTDAINQALTKAMRTASVSYLKHYFQPYGTLITVAELAGKAMQLRLDPLVYVAGTATLTPEAKDYLVKIGKLLQDRLKLSIKLCGKSVTQDGVTDKAARLLASQRAEMLKDMLVTQYSIATDRLFLCEPEFDIDIEGKPRVELLL
ncbi:MAG: DUF748 domain-containing protein [Gammaproteobacteria bacterium]|nr:DUF748 domain-containing protein [Gammaproteobacteria bacterium]MDH3406256.1 DUF748 domain-containing protein [Gammaproteobacteria bacterium]MDH5486879.1 DUF748 domain-containing protein [Gammaproteobacteria bacterium]